RQRLLQHPRLLDVASHTESQQFTWQFAIESPGNDHQAGPNVLCTEAANQFASLDVRQPEVRDDQVGWVSDAVFQSAKALAENAEIQWAESQPHCLRKNVRNRFLILDQHEAAARAIEWRQGKRGVGILVHLAQENGRPRSIFKARSS